MSATIRKNNPASDTWTTTHPLSPEDSAAIAALRSMVAGMKGKLEGSAARGPFNGIIESVAAPQGVTFEADTVGGISGWWARAANGKKGAAVLHLHGGWFNWGTAQAYRKLVGHIASSAGVDAFVPDYRLAPEHPFPSAVENAEASYRGLAERGITKIALSGDSAGGNLALVLLCVTGRQPSSGSVVPAGAVAFSPVTDLALTGESFATRAEEDPYFTLPPLYGNLAGLPAIRVHVGDDEVLLDDSRRYVERAVAAGVDATLDIWMGMPHGFISGVGNLNAATHALSAIGTFLNGQLAK